jgi:hypothetical protein
MYKQGYISRGKCCAKAMRQARACMSASYYLHESKNNGNNEIPALTTFHLIERLVKAFKIHRAAIDFYTGFVN